MLDTRAEVARLLNRFRSRSNRELLTFLLCAVAASAVAFLPAYPGLEEAGRWSLAIVAFGAGLWITEAIPSFAVALLVIGLQVAILGRPGGVLAASGDTSAWENYVRPWSSPPMWLFFGGLVLARAAQRTQLDSWLAGRVLGWTGGRPVLLLPAIMGVTFLLSMFMSNTATCAMMLAVLAPPLARLPPDSKVARNLLLGLAFAANLGGMGTIIGTPPNAIAASLLEDVHPIDFLDWTLRGLPPALLLFVCLWALLAHGMRGEARANRLDVAAPPEPAPDAEPTTPPQQLVVVAGFSATILLWMTGVWHGLPTAVVSFLPIVLFSITGVIRSEDIRSLQWDVLILLAGGLSLGVGIESSGLAAWLASGVAESSIPPWLATLALCWLAAGLSNLMSNTAAATILLPVTLVVAKGTGLAADAHLFLVPVALSASVAMALPISTPPNALVSASGRIHSRDYLPGGLLAFVLAPPLAVGWCHWLG